MFPSSQLAESYKRELDGVVLSNFQFKQFGPV